MLLGSELFARYWLGLGDPPLSIADPEIEYLFAPSRTYRRFGNTISYNRYSMRGTPDFPAVRSDPQELRIMVMGDSVINGGAQTDDRELATTLLRKSLSDRLERPVIVGNISAGSWGPPNLLAYARRFGFFDADMVIVVLNSEDYTDIPSAVSPAGRSNSLPIDTPVSALWEGFDRYLLPRLGLRDTDLDSTASPPPANAGEITKAALTDLVAMARASGADVIAALHPKRDELYSDAPGLAAFRQHLTTLEVPIVELTPAFQASEAGSNPAYRDNIHPTAAGQSLIAEELLPVVVEHARPAR